MTSSAGLDLANIPDGERRHSRGRVSGLLEDELQSDSEVVEDAGESGKSGSWSSETGEQDGLMM